MKYRLPCSCGETILIEAGQAGQKVRCTCGNELDVPTMRHIRQLEPARSEAPAKSRRSRTWSVAQRLVFALGLAVMVPGLAVATFFQLARAGLDTEPQVWDVKLESDLARLENMSLDEAWTYWKQVRNSGIGPYFPPAYVQSRMVSQYWLRIVKVGLSVAVVGLVVLLSAFVIPRHDASPRKRPTRKKPPAPKDRG